MAPRTNRRTLPAVIGCWLAASGLSAAGAESQPATDEIACLIGAFSAVQEYWVENGYRGQLSYGGADDPEKFSFYLDKPPVGYSFFGITPQQKYDKMLETLFYDDETLRTRFAADCAE